jgi:hypothetical protein
MPEIFVMFSWLLKKGSRSFNATNAQGRFIMKRLTALLLALILCFVIWGAPVYGDPGDETDPDNDSTDVAWDNPDYPPPPPGYEGPWPPPDGYETDGGEGDGSGDGGDEGGWTNPGQ